MLTRRFLAFQILAVLLALTVAGCQDTHQSNKDSADPDGNGEPASTPGAPNNPGAAGDIELPEGVDRAELMGGTDDPFPGQECLANLAGKPPENSLCACSFLDCQGTQIDCQCAAECYANPMPEECAFKLGECDENGVCNATGAGDVGGFFGEICGGGGVAMVCYDEDDVRTYQECSVSECEVNILPVEVEEDWCYSGTCTGDDSITLAWVRGWSENEAGENVDDGELACIRATMGLAIVNTSYGDNSFHSWKELHHSDHLQIEMRDNSSTVLCSAIYDIFTDDGNGNYHSLGIWGGGKDGSIVDGDKCDAIVSIETSMDYNWEHACGGAGWHDTNNSPTEAECPDWEDEYWWDVCFTKAGLGIEKVEDLLVTFPSLHASPSTCDDNTVQLDATPVPCP